MSQTRIRVLFATAAADPFIERIEAQLAAALSGAGDDLLLLVEGRDPPNRSIPNIDAYDWTDEERPPCHNVGLRRELAQIVEDTCWNATVGGYGHDRAAIEDRLVAAAHRIDQILADYRPHVVLAWNGLLGVRAVVINRARKAGIFVRFCERGPLPGSWYADPHGINAASSIAVPPLPLDLKSAMDSPLPDADRASIIADLAETARAGASAWEQAGLRGPEFWRTRLNVAPGQAILFFPMQVEADTNMRFFSPHFEGSLAALEAVAQAVRSMPGWFLLVKPHPKGDYPPGAIEQIVDDRGSTVAEINLHDALSLSDLVVTINSTVACEAAWSGRPVLQLGEGILSGKGIVAEYQPERSLPEQLTQALADWRSDSRRRDRGLRFYQFLKSSYLLQADRHADASRLVERWRGLARGGAADPPPASARSCADAHAWLPARDTLDQLADRQPAPSTVVLVGYGRNARKLLAGATKHPAGDRIRWAAWDDDPAARTRAAQDGLEIREPERCYDTDALLVVTARNPGVLIRNLESLGYAEDHDFLVMFPKAVPPLILR